jgi:hypothetical protein
MIKCHFYIKEAKTKDKYLLLAKATERWINIDVIHRLQVKKRWKAFYKHLSCFRRHCQYRITYKYGGVVNGRNIKRVVPFGE